MSDRVPETGYDSARPQHTAAYLRGAVLDLLPKAQRARVLDIGCGNGYWIGQLLQLGLTGVGIDPSAEGMSIARKTYPAARFEQTTVSEDLLQRLNEAPFDVVVSMEVVEHVYDPRAWAHGAFRALRPGGRLICSTPYHGYLKNLVISLTDKWDEHLRPLWDGGHIKFWSRPTLTSLLEEAGFVNIQFRGTGRLPYLWKSMVLSGDRPS